MILSIFFGFHDSCVTFASRERILLHLEGERVLRRKHARMLAQEMEELVQIGLDYLGASIQDVEELLLAEWFSNFSLSSVQLCGRTFVPLISSHHHNHIGCAISSGVDDFLASVADGGSEDGATKIYHWSQGKAHLLADFTDDIVTGKFYGTLTQIVVTPDYRLAHQDFPGKLMGLASLGAWSDRFAELVRQFSRELNSLYPKGCEWLREQFGLNTSYSNYWEDSACRDLAYTGQAIWVQRFLEIIEPFRSVSSNIAICGGCGLNIGLNQAIRDKGWFDEVIVPPVANDSGQSLGAVLYRYPSISCEYPFLGRSF